MLRHKILPYHRVRFPQQWCKATTRNARILNTSKATPEQRYEARKTKESVQEPRKQIEPAKANNLAPNWKQHSREFTSRSNYCAVQHHHLQEMVKAHKYSSTSVPNYKKARKALAKNNMCTSSFAQVQKAAQFPNQRHNTAKKFWKTECWLLIP